MAIQPNRWWIYKSVCFVAGLAPAIWLVWAALTGNLSANPLDDITDATGRWTLRFLLITLAISPLRQMTGWNALIRFRRMAGLFAFFYAGLHFIRYIWLDQDLVFSDMIVDVGQRPFITAGFVSFVVLIPLAITSTRKWVSRLGGKQWQRLHRLVYVSAIAGVVHYLWLVKLDIQRPVAYGVVLAALLAFRLKNVIKTPQPLEPKGSHKAKKHPPSNDTVMSSQKPLFNKKENRPA